MKKALIIIGLYLMVGAIEAKAECNPYTYENCSGPELRAVANVQFQQRNGIDRHIPVAEKYERVVTGKPSERWNKRFDNSYTVVLRNGVWTQELKRNKKRRNKR